MKSNLKISNIAKSYLNNDPLEWYTFVRNIGEKISSLSEIQVADQYVKAPILKNKALIQSIILEEFMNPDFVNLIAYNNRNTIEIISDHIRLRKFLFRKGASRRSTMFSAASNIRNSPCGWNIKKLREDEIYLKFSRLNRVTAWVAAYTGCCPNLFERFIETVFGHKSWRSGREAIPTV